FAQRGRTCQEPADALRSRSPAPQSDGNAVAGKGIDKRGCVANEYRIPAHRLRLAINQRSRADGLHERAPMRRSARQTWMQLADLFQRGRPVGADHGAGVHHAPGYWLHTAIAICKKIKIRTGLRPRFLKMCLEADPLGPRRDRPVSGEL